MARSPYTSLYERLTYNTYEPENEQSCWYWSGRYDRMGYGLVNLWVPGLQRITTLKAHVVLWVCLRGQPLNSNEAWLMYKEHVLSPLQLDHLCNCRACINPDHLDPVSASENCLRRRRN